MVKIKVRVVVLDNVRRNTTGEIVGNINNEPFVFAPGNLLNEVTAKGGREVLVMPPTATQICYSRRLSSGELVPLRKKEAAYFGGGTVREIKIKVDA